VDVQSFTTYIDGKTNSRQSQVEGYLRILRQRGEDVSEGDCHLQSLARDYMKKIYGRLYSSGPSLQKISKAARAKALGGIPGGVFELDLENSFLSLLATALRKLLDVEGGDEDMLLKEFPFLRHFNANREKWIAFVMEYYDADAVSAKRLFLSALSPHGRQTADPEARPDWLPHIDGLQQEIVKATGFLQSHDLLYRDVCEKRPDVSTLHIYLGELECRVMLSMKQCLESCGALPISLVYDGIYFRPMALDIHSDSHFHDSIAKVESEHGVSMQMKDTSGVKLPWRRVQEEESVQASAEQSQRCESEATGKVNIYGGRLDSR